jgi:hypothetical protein
MRVLPVGIEHALDVTVYDADAREHRRAAFFVTCINARIACHSGEPCWRSAPMSKHCQEQIQMITMVKGRATPIAPPIVNANADSRFASACSSIPDMLLLHRAQPRLKPLRRWVQRLLIV